METPQYITLSQLQGIIRGSLERAMPLSYWVAAEVSELKVNYSGHCYMQLTEKAVNGQGARAQVSAVAWRSSWGAIDAHFRSATGGSIVPGMKLLLRVSVSYHELYGLSLVVGDVDPSFTVGDMHAERERTIARLKKEGVFDMNRELPLHAPVQRVAVVSSRTAAGFRDFYRQIASSPYRIVLTLFEAVVQGEAAEGSVVAALDAVAERMEEFDAVAIIRGGGSQNDLKCFDAYRLCAHVAQFPLPVITGIGHDKDRSVADMVAAVELKTPTAAAVYLIDSMAGEEAMLHSLSGRLSQLVSAAAHRRGARLDTLATLLRERAKRALESRAARLQLLDSRVQAFDPGRITTLGFAIVRANGRIVRSPAQLTRGERLDITLADGRIEATVEM